jgi:hypothetical protein
VGCEEITAAVGDAAETTAASSVRGRNAKNIGEREEGLERGHESLGWTYWHSRFNTRESQPFRNFDLERIWP